MAKKMGAVSDIFLRKIGRALKRRVPCMHIAAQRTPLGISHAWTLAASGRPSGCRDDEGDRGVQSLGGGERPIVFKFTGAAIGLDGVKSHPRCRLLVAKSVEQCLIRSLIVRKNHAVLSAHRVRAQS